MKKPIYILLFVVSIALLHALPMETKLGHQKTLLDEPEQEFRENQNRFQSIERIEELSELREDQGAKELVENETKEKALQLTIEDFKNAAEQYPSAECFFLDENKNIVAETKFSNFSQSIDSFDRAANVMIWRYWEEALKKHWEEVLKAQYGEKDAAEYAGEFISFYKGECLSKYSKIKSNSNFFLSASIIIDTLDELHQKLNQFTNSTNLCRARTTFIDKKHSFLASPNFFDNDFKKASQDSDEKIDGKNDRNSPFDKNDKNKSV